MTEKEREQERRAAPESGKRTGDPVDAIFCGRTTIELKPGENNGRIGSAQAGIQHHWQMAHDGGNGRNPTLWGWHITLNCGENYVKDSLLLSTLSEYRINWHIAPLSLNSPPLIQRQVQNYHFDTSYVISPWRIKNPRSGT